MGHIVDGGRKMDYTSVSSGEVARYLERAGCNTGHATNMFEIGGHSAAI